MAAIIPVDKPGDSNLGENTAAERGKAVKLAKGGAFQLQISLYQRSRNTPVFIDQLLLFFFAPSHCPYRKNCTDMKAPNNPHYFPATFNGVIRWKLKSLADTNVVIIAPFSQNYQTV